MISKRILLAFAGLGLAVVTTSGVPAGIAPRGDGDSVGKQGPTRQTVYRSKSKPNLWRVVEPIPAPRKKFDSTAPVVNVAAEAALTPTGDADLEPNIDVMITQEIDDLAAELGSAAAIYEFVRNECEFQPYYGSRKGSVETLHHRAGNDYDQASLLIALLRSAGIPARYADGIVEMTVEQANAWLAVDHGNIAGSIFTTVGMEGVTIGDGQGPVAIEARRVWVEAFTPRGFGSPVWVPLDPAFTRSEVEPGIDIPEEMNLDTSAFVSEYYDPSDAGVKLPRDQTVLEVLEQELTTYIDQMYPGMTLADMKRTHEVVPEELGALPASLPYLVRSRDSQYSEIPANRRYQIRFHVRDGGTTMINHTLDLPAIAGKRVSIDYIGETAQDQATIDSFGGIYYTPPSQVDLKPVLRVDGQDVATGVSGIGMALVHQSDIYFQAASNNSGLPQNLVPAIFNTMTAGASQVIGIAIEGVPERLMQPAPDDDTEGLASLRYDTAMDYLGSVHDTDVALSRIMHAHINTDVSDAIVENVVSVSYDFQGVPQTFDWVGLSVDADRSVLGVWPVEGYEPSDPEGRNFLVLSGAEASLFESLIYEESYGQEAVSTIKILELAAAAGITIYERWNSLPLPANTQGALVRNAIQNAIAIGHEVTFPADPMVIGDPGPAQWTGTGWIDMNPVTGAAGYLISGGQNGGATVERWPPEFIDLSQEDKTIRRVEIEIISPVEDSPHADAIFPRETDEHLEFKYKVHVTYDDNSMKTFPEGAESFMRRTRNTTMTLFPSNYTFQVWIARRGWWSFSNTIARAERDVSVVGVLIREDDGTLPGKRPPEFMGVKSVKAAERVVPPTVPLKALVLPEMAPDGTPMAQGYSWTGGPKLEFDPDNDQFTDLGPSSPDPSEELEDQDVDVLVSILGGKETNGYRKFILREGAMDERHKMTLVKVQLIPNYDRDSDIGEDDRAKASANDPYYFWINNDDDESANEGQDAPGQGRADFEDDSAFPFAGTYVVDSVRDFIDFFPVWVDIKDTLDLLPTDEYEYIIKHSSGAFNALINPGLTPAQADKHLYNGTFAMAYDDEELEHITSEGYTLEEDFLNAIQVNKALILVEGRSATQAPLVLEVKNKEDGETLLESEMTVSMASVAQMFRHYNIRGITGGTGGAPNRLGSPPNYPDSLTNNKDFVFAHGYNVNGDAAFATHCEVFKRMYWSGSNAKYHGISWRGDQTQIIFSGFTPNYHINVVNALNTAQTLANYINGLGGAELLAAHSLGNMLSGAAITLKGANVSNYVIIDGAVPMEAYDGSLMKPAGMLSDHWDPYIFPGFVDPEYLLSSEWHKLFLSTDSRNKLTWRDFFSNMGGTNVYNYYTPGEDVVGNVGHTTNCLFSAAEFPWGCQEKFKGRTLAAITTFTSYAGWGFNEDDYGTTIPNLFGPNLWIPASSASASTTPTAQLVTQPFFKKNPEELFHVNGVTARAYATANMYELLGKGFPARTFGIAANPIGVFTSRNMPSTLRSGWFEATVSWGHSEFLNVAYLHTYPLYDQMVADGGLE